MARIFISHNTKDKQFVNKLGKDLQEKGVKVWIDEAELQVGDSLIKKIEIAIAEVDYLAAVLSKNSITSEWVKRELEVALTREIHNKRIFVLPIILDNCDIPPFLSGRMYLDFSNESDYNKNLEKIYQRLGASQASPPSPTALNGKMPFAIPVYALRENTSEYKYIGSIPSPEDGIYVNMIYITASSMIVDLLIPGSVFDAYNIEIFEDYIERNLVSYDMYSARELGWVEVAIARDGRTPQDMERECLDIITMHNNELRWLLHFANRLR